MAFNPITQTFNTVAELKTLKGTANTRVKVLGYTSIADSGEMEFYWDNTSTETANDVTIFQVTGVATGRWKRTNYSTVTAIQCGAVPGETDSTTILTDALAITGIERIVFDHPDGFTLTEELVVPSGKILQFINDSFLNITGVNGALNGGIIECDFLKQCFAGTLTVTGLLNNKVSAKWWGALANSFSTNNYPAIAKSIASISKGTVYIPGASAFYWVQSPIVIDKAIRLLGDVGGLYGTSLYFETSGIVLEDVLGIQLENLILDGFQGGDDFSKKGIFSNTRFSARNVHVYSFGGNGWEINTTVSGQANICSIIDCSATGNLGNGLYLEGNDANACNFINFNSTQNRRVGIYDKSFLGNFYRGLHLATNGKIAGQTGWVLHNGEYYAAIEFNTDVEPGVDAGWETYWQIAPATAFAISWDDTTEFVPTGSFIGMNVNQKTVASGYTEGDQAPVYLSGSSYWNGGLVGTGYHRFTPSLDAASGLLTSNTGFHMYDKNSVVLNERTYGIDNEGINLTYQNGALLGIRGFDSDGFTRIVAQPQVYGSVLESIGFTMKPNSRTASLYGRVADIDRGEVVFGYRGFHFRDMSAPTTNLRMINGSTVEPSDGDYGGGDFVFNIGTANNSILGWKFYSGIWNAINIGVTDGDKGNITVSSSGTVWTIDNGVVTNAMLAGSIDLTTKVTGNLPLANGGTGASLSDPGADRILFWDDSAGTMEWLTVGTNLSISGTTLNATAGAGGYATIQDEGLSTTQYTTINIVGAGITASEDALNSRTEIALDATLNALATYNTNGILTQTALDTFVGRTITGTANQISVANGDGVSGNPTLSLPADVIIPTVLTVPNAGLHILDTNASHDLIISPGSDLSADRTLSIVTGDSNRTLTFTADASIGGTNTGDQTITLTGDVTGSGTGSFAATIASAALQDIIALGDPGADRLLFWDDSDGNIVYLTLGTNLSITGTTLNATGGGSVAWGAITGTLSDQTDLQSALDAKVTGPASATDNAVVRFDSTTGKLVQNSAVTIADTSGNIAGVGTLNTHTIPGGTDTFALLAATQTLTNKRVNPRVQSVSSSATVTPSADSDDIVIITAQAAGLTLANPSGTPVQGQAIVIRIKDNGTARSITYGSEYRALGVTLPTTTVISKTLYLGMIFNSTDTKWDVTGVSQEA